MASVRSSLCRGEHELRAAQSRLQVADENAIIAEGFGPPTGEDPFEGLLDEAPRLSSEEKAAQLDRARAAYAADRAAARLERAQVEAKLRAAFGWLLFFPIEIVIALLTIIVAPLPKKLIPSFTTLVDPRNLAKTFRDAGLTGARIARFRACA